MPKPSAMQLRWPPSVAYQERAYSYDPDGSLHRALRVQVDRMRTNKEPDEDTHHSSSETGIASCQTPPPEPRNTSYGPLHGTVIRILRLVPGGQQDPLHGHFELIHLQDQDPGSGEPEEISRGDKESPTPYEAVSYTWANSLGDREKRKVIYIGNRWDILYITENCFDALRTCRFEEEDRRLWIDAICINQTNIPERTHQVRMMRNIYSAARRVLIFLGTDHTQRLTGLVENDPEIMINNPYFSRVWVIQEIASAKEALVLCAGQTMHWSFFHTNLRRLAITTWVQQFDRARRIDIDSFITLLQDTRGCQATDPRDKVFALLGLSTAPLDPDYTLSPQAVYTGLAASLVTNGKELAGRILDLASHGQSMPGLPSWVPDWSFLAKQLCKKHWNRHHSLPVESWVRRPMATQQIFRVHRETGSLCVQAVEIDTLARFLRHGFHATFNGIATATAGKAQISVASQLAPRCEPHDRVFSLSEYKFSLILRKVADPHIYILVGLCEYCVQSNLETVEVEAIRHLFDWEWLLLDRGMWCWSELASWEKVQTVWSSLEDLYKLERRIWLRRLILKARFVTKLLNLVESVRHMSTSCATNFSPASAFFWRRWTWISRQWLTEDSRLISLQQQRESELRQLLRGYKSLDVSQEVLGTVQLKQSMWLPVSYDWFKWLERRDMVHLVSRYPLLEACAAKRIPLPPLQLVNNLKKQLVLSTSTSLETGLRQLQRLAQDYPLKPPALGSKSHSYMFETREWYRLNFRAEHWSVFLRWLAEPSSPTTCYLNSEASQNGMTIWEKGFRTQKKIGDLHNYATVKFPIHTLGTEFARAFYWRFSRSFDKACQLARREHVGPCKIEEQWTKFLGWLAQESCDPHAAEVPSDEIVPRHRPNDNSEKLCTGFSRFAFLPYHRWFTSTEPPEPRVDEGLSEPVHSEIQRRRLAERLFAPLFDERCEVQQARLQCPEFEAAAPDTMAVIRGPLLVEEWKRRDKFWREMMDYVSASERHMSILKPSILGGLMQDGKTENPENVYKEIVII
ncbi:hypothetical protein CEP54_010545 [Fusarium duplospermum]|uniref:Heterokaryon incompatibility domain-containing protein n=1 Tax=Fusarium duplospermum TaxID=1325734 RepID=A0A428PJA7_9HYPO|nr:hypothetical protein CEP54_010545 [Fusarium duplospermum]